MTTGSKNITGNLADEPANDLADDLASNGAGTADGETANTPGRTAAETGLHIERRFTTPGKNPYDTVEWVRTHSH